MEVGKQHIYLALNMQSRPTVPTIYQNATHDCSNLGLPPTRSHVKNINFPLIPPTQTPSSPPRCNTSTPTASPHRAMPANAAITPVVRLLDDLDNVFFVLELADFVVIRKMLDERLDVATDSVRLCVL